MGLMHISGHGAAIIDLDVAACVSLKHRVSFFYFSAAPDLLGGTAVQTSNSKSPFSYAESV